MEPFLHVCDSRGRDIGWVLITAPVSTRAQHVELARLLGGGYAFAGVTGYRRWPRWRAGDARDYGTLCRAWCHCARDPVGFVPPDVPRIRLALSDFTDPHRVVTAAAAAAECVECEHDIVYVGASEDWKRTCKGWELAASCLHEVCASLDLRALVVGTPDVGFTASDRVRFIAELPWPDFLATVAGARVLLVAGEDDPSPRVIAEALCLDVAVAVNRGIIGGWHYVNAFTGALFDDSDSVVGAVERCLRIQGRPSRWFAAHFGPMRSGARLLALLRSVDPSIAERSHLTVTSRLARAS